jgi:Uma2 family endonuclease
VVTRAKLTVEEYLALPEEPPYSEYAYGEVLEKMSPVPAHAKVINELAFQFGVYRRHHGGSGGPELRVEFRTARGFEYRLPDYCYYAPGTPMGGPRFGNPPTLAIEVRSPGESIEQQRAKCRYYRQYGVPIAWLVDPESRTVEVFDDRTDGLRLAGDETLTSPDLPGFSLKPDELFAALD